MSISNKALKIDIDFLKSASKKKFGIVSSEWNPEIINRLLQGSFDFFYEIGISRDKIELLNVPGSFELVYGCSKFVSKVLRF